MEAKQRKTKSPNDYPLLGYRVQPGIKSELVDLLEEVQLKLNERRLATEKPYKKNDVFVEALSIGLRQMQKRN